MNQDTRGAKRAADIERANVVGSVGRAGALTDSLAEREKVQDIPPLTEAQLAEQNRLAEGSPATVAPNSWLNPRPVVHPHDSNQQVALRTALAHSSACRTSVNIAGLLKGAEAITKWLDDRTLPTDSANT